jgi:hypothetical protein
MKIQIDIFSSVKIFIRRNRALTLGSLCVLFISVISCIIYSKHFGYTTISGNKEDWAFFFAFFSGLTTPLLTIFGFLLIILQLRDSDRKYLEDKAIDSIKDYIERVKDIGETTLYTFEQKVALHQSMPNSLPIKLLLAMDDSKLISFHPSTEAIEKLYEVNNILSSCLELFPHVKIMVSYKRRLLVELAVYTVLFEKFTRLEMVKTYFACSKHRKAYEQFLPLLAHKCHRIQKYLAAVEIQLMDPK